MYEDNDEEYKPDGTEQANLAATKYKTEALEEIRAKMIAATNPIGEYQTSPPLRPVTIREYVNHHPGTQVVGKGRFHQWGVDVDHADMGSGTYSIAIVEMEDGTVRCVMPDLIKFED